MDGSIGGLGIFALSTLVITTLSGNSKTKSSARGTDLGVVQPGCRIKGYVVDRATLHYLGRRALEDDATWEEVPAEVDARDIDTPDAWIKRHPALIRLTGRHPFNCEAPLSALFEKGFITPNALHYVRTHGSTPSGDWSNHKIYLGGLVKNPVVVTMVYTHICIYTIHTFYTQKPTLTLTNTHTYRRMTS